MSKSSGLKAALAGSLALGQPDVTNGMAYTNPQGTFTAGGSLPHLGFRSNEHDVQGHRSLTNLDDASSSSGPHTSIMSTEGQSAANDSSNTAPSRSYVHMPRALRELEDFLSAPPPSAKSSPDIHELSPEPHQPVKPPRQLTRLEKELGLNNDTYPSMLMNQDNFEDARVWNTRGTARALERIKNNENIEAQKSLSLKNMMRRQTLPRNTNRKDSNAVGAMGVPVKAGLDDVDDDDSLSSWGTASTGFDSDSFSSDIANDKTYSTHKKTPFTITSTADTSRIQNNRKPTARATTKSKLLKEEFKVEELYAQWLEKKERILELISSPEYNPDQLEPESGITGSVPAYDPSAAVHEGFNMTMENGCYVFAPTVDVFREFERFLATVEELAGRKAGVVKVVVPKKTLDESEQPFFISDGVDAVIAASMKVKHSVGSKTNRTRELLTAAPHMLELMNEKSKPELNLAAYSLGMTLNKSSRSNRALFYNVSSERKADVPATLWRQVIEDHRKSIISESGVHCDRWTMPWKNADYDYCRYENKMINEFNHGKHDAYYAMDNDASPELRETLQCLDPKVVALPGNSLRKSKFSIAGIHSPYFYVSRSEGTPFALHIEDYAAYSVNYLHAGAPKCWTVVKPTHHHKLEEFLHGQLNAPEKLLSRSLGRKPQRPPQCSQFLRHHSVYLPRETFQTLELDTTTVVQHRGEMVITFPFAYHQGFNSGPNIAEAIGYASNRWEVFIREGLYQRCHKINCKVEPVRLDFDFLRAAPALPPGPALKAANERIDTSSPLEAQEKMRAMAQGLPTLGRLNAFNTGSERFEHVSGSSRSKASLNDEDSEWDEPESGNSPELQEEFSPRNRLKRAAGFSNKALRSARRAFTNTHKYISPESLSSHTPENIISMSVEDAFRRRSGSSNYATHHNNLIATQMDSNYKTLPPSSVFQHGLEVESPDFGNTYHNPAPIPSVSHPYAIPPQSDLQDSHIDWTAPVQGGKGIVKALAAEPQSFPFDRTSPFESLSQLQMPTPEPSTMSSTDPSPTGYGLISSRESSNDPSYKRKTEAQDYSKAWREWQPDRHSRTSEEGKSL
ncbi:MAG: hypothetical protein M1827_004574 [Pycnora praestabilis]|nr:MAG: hypothetical protein M1827_004574 [Pycnora praestabilis]